jgi:D-serine deaminase-like pyridoxal phosphate-dependent protein
VDLARSASLPTMGDFGLMRRALVGKSVPAVVVDLRAFDENARSLAAEVSRRRPGFTLRLATKSFRVPELLRRVLDSSPVFQGLMCYSADELVFLADAGFDDLLLAYPTLQKGALVAMAQRAGSKKISVVLDSVEGVEALACAAKECDATIGCVLELDVSRLGAFLPRLGARRSSLRSLADLVPLLERISAHRGLRFEGLMAYEAQVAGVQDRSPFRGMFLNFVTGWMRKLEARGVARRRAEVFQALADRQISTRLVNGGGSGSLSFALGEPGLTEIAVGSAILAPHLFSAYSNLKVEAALFVALECVRSSEAGWVTCSGGGYVASGAPGRDRLLVPVDPAGSELSDLEGCGEVQTPLKLAVGEKLALGDVTFWRPAKAGEIAERFSTYHLWDGTALRETPTYRGLGACFP